MWCNRGCGVVGVGAGTLSASVHVAIMANGFSTARPSSGTHCTGWPEAMLSTAVHQGKGWV